MKLTYEDFIRMIKEVETELANATDENREKLELELMVLEDRLETIIDKGRE